MHELHCSSLIAISVSTQRKRNPLTNTTPLVTKEQAFNIQVSGLVQGVGFRPRVWNLAQRHDIRGRVSNDGNGLQILVAGEENNVRKFMADLTIFSSL